MGKKYYAVKFGKIPGIYLTWSECEKQIKGVSGAKYQGFSDLESAQEFIENNEEDKTTDANLNGITNEDVDSEIHALKNGEVIAFVDGSYSDSEKKAGFGVIIIDDVGVETQLYRAYTDKISAELIEMRNFAAELLGVMEAISWAATYNKSHISIYYDYEGIEKLITGEWRAKNDLSRKYVSFVKDKKNVIGVDYIKVPAHSGIDYNERVDALAKNSLLENGYKTYDDGSIYFVGFSSDDWKSVVELIDEENSDLTDDKNKKIDFKIDASSEGKQRIEIKSGNNKVVINCYKNSKSYVQGKQSPLFQKIVSNAILMLKTDEIVVETLNKIHVLTITQEEIENSFEYILPDYKGEREGKHYNNLLAAIYNTKLSGYMPDYTCLVTPIFRAYEKYLHAILGDKMGLDTCRNNGTNNFSYFEKNTSGGYECNSSSKSILTQNQLDYLNLLYTTYNAIRHQYSHWSADDYDSAVITEMAVAQSYLSEGLTLVNNHYKIF